jgi:polar amino acid transport system substrate-binding protein
MTLDSTITASFAPSGTLRVAINLGNPILARAGEDPARPSGISVDIATELARRLSVPIEFVVVDAARKSVEAVANDHADVGFFAADPVRAAHIEFTEPYLLIEGCYLVERDSAVTTNEQVDTPHNRVAVGASSAYDLFLTRELHHAAARSGGRCETATGRGRAALRQPPADRATVHGYPAGDGRCACARPCRIAVPRSVH